MLVPTVLSYKKSSEFWLGLSFQVISSVPVDEKLLKTQHD
jgi:hypothetical protein